MMSLKHRPAAVAALLAAALAALLLGALVGSASEAFGARKPRARRASLPNPAALALPAPRTAVPWIEAHREHPDHFFIHNLAAARVVDTNEFGSQLIVVPAIPRDIPEPWPTRGQHICLFHTDETWPASGGGTCTPVADFKREGIVQKGSMDDGSPEDVMVFVPNGVRSVTVESPAGSRSLPVKNNLVRFWRTTEHAVKFTGPAGTVRTPIAPGGE